MESNNRLLSGQRADIRNAAEWQRGTDAATSPGWIGINTKKKWSDNKGDAKKHIHLQADCVKLAGTSREIRPEWCGDGGSSGVPNAAETHTNVFPNIE